MKNNRFRAAFLLGALLLRLVPLGRAAEAGSKETPLGSYDAHRLVWGVFQSYRDASLSNAAATTRLPRESEAKLGALQHQMDRIDESKQAYFDELATTPSIYKGEFETTEEFKARVTAAKLSRDKEITSKILSLVDKWRDLNKELSKAKEEFRSRAESLKSVSKPPELAGLRQFKVKVDMGTYDADSSRIPSFTPRDYSWPATYGELPRFYQVTGSIAGIQIARDKAMKLREVSNRGTLWAGFRADAIAPRYETELTVKMMSDSAYAYDLAESRKTKAEAIGTGALTIAAGLAALALGADPDAVNASAAYGGDEARKKWNEKSTPQQYNTQSGYIIYLGWRDIARPADLYEINPEGRETVIWSDPSTK